MGHPHFLGPQRCRGHHCREFGRGEGGRGKRRAERERHRRSRGSVYGKEAGDKFFPLLAGHYGAVKEYLNADIAGNKEAKDAAVGNLGKNVEEIATFLISANPNWPKATPVELLMAHGGHHIAQIDQLLAKDYASEAKTWDAMSKHMNVIADALASGIVKQFPKKF